MIGTLVVYIVVGSGMTPVAMARLPTAPGSANSVNNSVEEVAQRMQQRHSAGLKDALNNQYIAVTTSGWLNPHPSNMAHLSPVERAQVKKMIEEENKDRRALYKTLACLYERPEWEKQIRSSFAEEWLKAAEQSKWLVFNPLFGSFTHV